LVPAEASEASVPVPASSLRALERSILPPIAEQELHLVAKTAVLSFIVVFGVT
jgi:hypothetical protein